MAAAETSLPFTHATGRSGFRGDKYYRYTKTSVTVMAGWPRMLAWQRSARRPGWRMVRPECGPPSLDAPVRCTGACALSGDAERSPHCRRGPDDCHREHDHWLQWSALIPMEVRLLVRAYRERHWHLLSLAARCGQPAIDLMAANPALAWALASSWVFRVQPVREPMRAARRLLAPGRSQRDILGWLGFPATDAARRALRKLPPQNASVNTLLALRNALHDPVAARTLAHLPALNHDVVRIVSDPQLRPLASHALLLDLLSLPARPGPEAGRYAEAAMKLRDCLGLLDALELPAHSLRALRTLAELETRHDELVMQQRLLLQAAGPDAPAWRELPPPPLPDSPTIIGLRTGQELTDEGVAMQHCVGGYGARVAAGECAIFRVLAPERATVAIARSGGAWRVAELRLAFNREPDLKTRKAVEHWLLQCGNHRDC